MSMGMLSIQGSKNKTKIILSIVLLILVVIIIPSIVLIICGRMEEVEPVDPQWGIEQSVENVTSTGLTLVWNRDDAQNITHLHTGEDYYIEKKTLFGWRTVPTIIDDYAWPMGAYSITVHRTTRQEIDWEWMYGDLSNGTYRIRKTISLPIVGDIVGRCYTEFEIR